MITLKKYSVMNPFLFITLMLCVKNSAAVIDKINRLEHGRMPPVFHFDRYEPCLLRNNGTGEYCSVKFDLVTDEPSELYHLITEYSAKRETHLNHTKLFYGICFTKTCEHFYKRDTTADRGHILEAYLNETFWDEYKLKTRVIQATCHTLDSKPEWDYSDYSFGAFICVLLVLILLGTLQSCFLGDENEGKGSAILSCFSISRNWKRLVSPAGEGPDPRLKRLIGCNGVKAICIIYVVTGHGIFPLAYHSDTTYSTEQEKFNNTVMLLFINGGQLIIQWCFMVSSFLLFYNMEIYAEKHQITWKMLPKAVFVRWLRFSPAYAVVLAYTVTWMRHFGAGPLYDNAVMQEVRSCRRDWWMNLLYLSNFVSTDPCFIQSWYISADFQLFFLGMAVYALFAGATRRLVLAGLFIIGVILPPALTYFKDLDGVLLMSLENIRNIFNNDPTFHNVYNKSYTNLPCYIAGLALGLLVYHLQKIGYKVPKTAGVRFLYWMTLPFTVVIAYYGALLYEGQVSLVNRTLYAGLYKPLWAIVGAFFIFGIVNQIEDVYRGVVEWRGWTVPSRLSYSFFLVHLVLIRLINGTKSTTLDVGYLNIFELMTSIFLISFLAAIPFHLLVEAPFSQLTKLLMSPSTKPRKDVGNQTVIANGKTPEIVNDQNDNIQNGVRRRLTEKSG